MATPNMNLSLPTVSSTPGPLWANNINAALTTVDSHNHTSGNGVQIPAAGLNINGDLSFNSNNATTLRSVRFGPQTSPLSVGTDLGCLYNVNGNLYWNSGAGAQVQLTIGGALNATSIGGIGGDYATSTASVFYTSGINTFTFWRSSNVNANLDIAQVKIRYPSAGAYYCGLNASASMVADVNLTLPTALPGSQKFMTLDSSGNIAAPWAVDGSTLEVASGTTVQIKNSGVTLAKLDSAVIQTLVPTGTILSFGGTVAPAGFLICDGSQVNRTGTYAALFDALSPAQSCNTTNANATVTVTDSSGMQAGMAVFGAGIPNNTVISSISNATTIVISQNATATQTGVSLRFGGFGQGNLSTTFNLPDFRGRFLRGVDGTAGRDPDKASRTAMNSGSNTGNNVGSVQDQQFASHTHGYWSVQNGIGAGAGASGYTVTISATTPTTSTGGNETRPVNAYVNYIIKF